MISYNKNIRCREELSSDRNFLLKLYKETRAEEMKGWEASDEQKEIFLMSQFEAQHKHYNNFYSNATFQIIEFKKKPIGRIYVNREENEIRLVDISLLSKYRGRGIGSDFVKSLIKEAGSQQKNLTLHVYPGVRAHNYYKRMGFKEAGENQGYVFMKLEPDVVVE